MSKDHWSHYLFYKPNAVKNAENAYEMLGRSLIYACEFEDITKLFARLIGLRIEKDTLFHEEKYARVKNEIAKIMNSNNLGHRLDRLKRIVTFDQDVEKKLENGRLARNIVVHNIPLRLYEKMANQESTHLLLYELCEKVKLIAQADLIFKYSIRLYHYIYNDPRFETELRFQFILPYIDNIETSHSVQYQNYIINWIKDG